MTFQDSTLGIVPLRTFKAHTGDVDDLDISPNGKLCISVGHDAAVSIWDTSTGKQICSLTVPKEIGDGFRVKINKKSGTKDSRPTSFEATVFGAKIFGKKRKKR